MTFGALRAGEILDDVFHSTDGRMELAHDVRDAHLCSCPEKPRAPTRRARLRSVLDRCAPWRDIFASTSRFSRYAVVLPPRISAASREGCCLVYGRGISLGGSLAVSFCYRRRGCWGRLRVFV